MKKIISLLAAGALALGLIGCSGDLHDASTPDALYMVGDNGGSFIQMTKNDSSFTTTFTYQNTMTSWGGGNGKMNFKFTFVPGWTAGKSIGNDNPTDAPKIAATLADANAFALSEGANPGNITVEGFVNGKDYTVTVSVDATGKFSITIVGYVFEGLKTPANVSAINSETVVQEGAYIKFEGSSCALFDKLHIYFNGSNIGKAYVVADQAYSCTDWGGTYFAAWFKFYAGAGVELLQASKQFGAGTTTLGNTVDIDNDGGTSNLEVTNLTTISMGDVYCVTVDASGATPTFMVKKVN